MQQQTAVGSQTQQNLKIILSQLDQRELTIAAGQRNGRDLEERGIAAGLTTHDER
jgi:hypothetical protein